jgi:hypothetical protein
MSKKDFNDKASRKGLTDDELLDLVQGQTLKYFWDFAHPVSGMARERSNASKAEWGYDLDTVTTGGTGFGIMALIAGAERGFIAKKDLLAHLEKMVDFLDKADKFHGAFPHFLDGNTGKVVPFSKFDDGGDLVETSFLMMGLLTARQYFAAEPAAKDLCDKINRLWEGVEWDKYRKPGTDDLFWHWSPNHDFAMNHRIRGWNECLITHVLAASSPTHGVDAVPYEKGWVRGLDFENGDKAVGGIELPLGPHKGGPLFFSHYSFLGLNPKLLKDGHADYWEQNKAHTLTNRQHCIDNPKGFKGYAPDCWGLTASDNPDGYSAHSPTNDKGTIAPTAALSSFPYTPIYSMQALRHFYEDLGDKLWGAYGFADAFCEDRKWTAKSYLAIDQGPIVAMIENHRSGLLWDLFMSCPEVKHGLDKLGFESEDKMQPALKPAQPAKPPAP